MRLVRGLVRLEPPSWWSRWLEAQRLLLRVFPDHEALGRRDCRTTWSARSPHVIGNGSRHDDALLDDAAQVRPFALKVLPQ
jgi:hypothetical protein